MRPITKTASMPYRLILSILFISVLGLSSKAQNKAFWATIWSINSPEKIDNIIKTAKDNHFNQLFIQVRYRGDALYFPNKTDSSFHNPEQRSYILKGSKFDPLQYTINKLKGSTIEVYAWVPIFVVSPRDLSKIKAQHIFYQHANWITTKQSGVPMKNTEHEGAFLDPGIVEVQQYLLNILGDIATNYSIAGIQMDYIRYPDSIYGYNPLALKRYKESKEADFSLWKQEQINNFVNKAYILIKNINPKIQLSAAVIGNQQKAIDNSSQNWKQWLKDSYIDHVYVMAYNASNKSFNNLLLTIDEIRRDKTTIVMRAWKDKKPYSVHQINEKINLCKRYGFFNLGFYSYSGLVKNHYLKHLKF